MAPADRPDVPSEVLDRLRAICTELPEVVEERAWVGVRWRVRTKTFAHVFVVDEGRPAAHAKALGHDGPACVLTFRSAGEELDILANGGAPFFAPIWFPDIIGVALDEATDWDEVTELCTESHCLLAPKRLSATVVRPAHDG